MLLKDIITTSNVKFSKETPHNLDEILNSAELAFLLNLNDKQSN